MTLTLHFDESGYTGRALLDPLQPHFVIASSLIGDEEARDLLRTAFPTYQGKEFKFQRIWAKPTSRNRLPAFAKAVGERAKDLYVWHIDKKFCVLTKMIDFLVEPPAHEAGFDFYQDAYAYRFANYVHFGLTKIGSPELYSATIEAYYAFAREPTEAQLDLLRYRLNVMANSVPKELNFFYRAALDGAVDFHRYCDIETFRDTMEIYVTSMLNHVSYWTLQRSGPFLIRHDRSAAFFAQRDLWAAMTSPAVPQQLHPVANGPSIPFPLPVAATEPTDSELSAAIQLCDVLAGLTAKVAGMREAQEDQTLLGEIMSTGMANVPCNAVAPTLDFPTRGPARRTGPDAVDRMCGIIRAGRAAGAAGPARPAA